MVLATVGKKRLIIQYIEMRNVGKETHLAGVGVNVVITSYSIHYTKIYELILPWQRTKIRHRLCRTCRLPGIRK